MNVIHPDFASKKRNYIMPEKRRAIEATQALQRATIKSCKVAGQFVVNIEILSKAVGQLDKTCREYSDSWKKINAKKLHHKSLRLRRMMENYLAESTHETDVSQPVCATTMRS